MMKSSQRQVVVARCMLAALALLCVVMQLAGSNLREAAAVAVIMQDEPTERLQVHVGTSRVIDSPWPVARVSITNPEIADVQVLTPNQVLLTGNALGSTDLLMWSEREEVWHARVDVQIDLSYVKVELAKVFPDAQLEVAQSRDMVVVSGQLRRIDDAERLNAVLSGFGVKYVDATSVAGVHQVQLHVRVAEVSRRAIRTLGVNALFGGNDVFGGVTYGTSTGGPLNPINIGAAADSPVTNIPFSFLADSVVSPGVTLFTGFPRADLQIFLQALAENQYVRLLAEPTLVAMSGEEASFLAGGEFPVPIVQGSTTGGGSTITVEYKEFGVRLDFQPIVLGDNTIRLRVSPEVSDLSDLGAVQIEGFRIPSVLTRRADTTLELKSGQTFAMAGLLNNFSNANNARIPLLGDLPVLGPLFRSVRYQSGETELVVLVTAELVEPMTYDDFVLPGDMHQAPNDWELYVEGRLEGVAKPLAPADEQWLREMGLDRLEGPGAWATHWQQPTISSAQHATEVVEEPPPPRIEDPSIADTVPPAPRPQ